MEKNGRNEISEAAIFARLLQTNKGDLTPAMARYVLTLEFSKEDKTRMHGLAVKNQDGQIAREEKEELHNFIKVSHLLTLLQSKARRSLSKKKVS